MLKCFWREEHTLSSPEFLVTRHQVTLIVPRKRKLSVSDMGTVLEQVVRNVK